MEPNRNAKVDEWIEVLPEDMKEIAKNLRNLIHEANTHFKEELKWKMPCFHIDNVNICYLQAAKKHVNLGFYSGASLKDEHHLLEGEGKKMRHMRIRTPDDIQPEKFKDLIREAVEYEA